jgi:2'-5' RNA ligase
MAFRAFISMDLPELETLKALGEELRRTGAALKIVDLRQVHLTLKFLGDTEEALAPRIVEAVRASVAGIRPFTVRLVGTGAFPNLRRMNVVWVGMEGAEPLVAIARRLEAGMELLGYPREGRDFSAHVTVARVKGPGGVDEVRRVLEARARDPFGEVLVDRVRLKKSVLTPAGPVYSTVQEVPL